MALDELTKQAYLSLKSKGYKNIYFVDFKGLNILFKPLSSTEYNDILDLEKYLDPTLINELVLKYTILYLSNYTISEWLDSIFCLAGYPDVLSDRILKISGFNNKDTFLGILAEKRNSASQIQSAIEIFICSAFPSYRPSDVQDMDMYEQLELYSKAELVLQQNINFEEILGAKSINVPVPEGYETTNPMLSKAAASRVDWKKIEAGEVVH